jgi:cytochrome P450
MGAPRRDGVGAVVLTGTTSGGGSVMERPRLPPGPRLPATLQTVAVIARPTAFLTWCRRRYGDVFTLRTRFGGPTVVVSDPALVREVFTGSTRVLHAGEANALVVGPVLGEHSVLTLDGPEHLRQRRLLLPPFHGEHLRGYERLMRDATLAAIERFPVGRAFPLLPEMHAITLQVILRAVFGTRAGVREDRLAAALRALLAPTTTPARLLVYALSGGRRADPVRARTLHVALARADDLLRREIADRRERADLAQRRDVCSLLLLARDDEGRPLTDEEVRDELMTVLVAGHETTATALAWVFERLLRHPGVRGTLERELADGGHDYLDAVIKETLRVRNVLVNVSRRVVEPYVLGEHLLPAGTTVMASITLTHRRADRYPRPVEFRPERFLGPNPPDTYTWIPFGGGPRRCLGASFALLELRTVVRTVLERTDLEPVGRAEPARRRGITVAPGRGARVRMARLAFRGDSGMTRGPTSTTDVRS